MCGGGQTNGASRPMGSFGTKPMTMPEMSTQYSVNNTPAAPTYGGPPPGSGQGPMNWGAAMQNLPGMSQAPQMSKPFSIGLDSMQPPKMPVNLAPPGMQGQSNPPPMDARMAYQSRMGPQAQTPLNGAYNYDALPQSVMDNQQKAGLYPGAPTPPGYSAPPPGPFADWMNPIMASMIGRAGAAPPGMNAYNPGNNTWGNIDWFPGYPRG